MATSRSGKRNPRPKALLLEVSQDWIKLLEVDDSRQGLRLVKAHLEPVDSDTDVSEQLRKVIDEKQFSKVPLLTCIPRQLVNVRLLELPSTDLREIHDMVELQVGRQTPYSLNEIFSGFKPLGTVRQGTYMRVMLAIVQRTLVRERYYAVEGAGLSVEQMAVSSEGVLNWFLYHTREDPPEKVQVLLDIDSFFTHMIVVHHGKAVYTKSILWGACQAEEGLDAFSQRAKEAFQSCTESLRGTPIDSVTLSGAAMHLDNIEDALTSALSVPCVKADCLDDLVPTPALESLRDDRYKTASLTALVGMALSPDDLDFNFIPDSVRMRHLLRLQARRWSVAAALAMTVMVVASLYALLAIGYRINRRSSIAAEADALEPRVVQVERMIEVIRATQMRLDARFLPEYLLPVVHQAVPEGIYLEALEFDASRSRFSMRGSAPQRRDIRELIRLLEESPVFTSVEEGGRTTMDRQERFAFQVVGDYLKGDR